VAVIVSALAPLTSDAVDVPNRNSPLEDRAIREGREAVTKQQWDRAIALLQPYLRAHPQDADGHNLLATNPSPDPSPRIRWVQ
jgi:hypothetical protein